MSYSVTISGNTFSVGLTEINFPVTIEQLSDAEITSKVTATQTAAANAQTAQGDAEAARDASQSARDTAEDHKLAAEAAATSATNTAAALTGFDLDAVAETKAVTAVDVFVYDTSKDSDGGAWRKRTQGTSWYNETLNTATRGSRREFPAVAVIVAESNKVTIYDGDDPALPMWMVFNAGTDYFIFASPSLSSVFMLNGVLCVGDASFDLYVAGFVSDKMQRYLDSSTVTWSGNIVNRNNAMIAIAVSGGLVNRQINDVAMTVLPDAPIDPATGLPVPTIAVATAGGVSVIKDDGTVVDATFAGNRNYVSTVDFSADNWVFATTSNVTNPAAWFPVLFEIPSADVANVGTTTGGNGVGFTFVDAPYINTSQYEAGTDAVASDQNLFLGKTVGFWKIPAVPDDTLAVMRKNMVSKITSTYNTGWMNGDIKGAFLADTDDTDLVATNTIADRSVNALTLTLGDAATVQPVASGAELVSYIFASAETVTLGSDISSSGVLMWWEKVSGDWRFYVNDLSGGTDYVDGVSGTVGTGLTISGTTLTFAASKEMSLARASATIPTADQILKIYNDEKVLFQDNAACTLYGASDAVTALAHDPDTDLLHVGTSAGRSVFQGLRRVSNTTTAVGTAISASNNLVVEE